jgi:alcohol dehydrogenase, propanol-preferring
LVAACSKGKYSGFTVDGTFSEYVLSFVKHVTPIPDNIESAEAASILCAVRPAPLPSRPNTHMLP